MNTHANTLSELSSLADMAAERIKQGYATQYITYTDQINLSLWTIRIGDHACNPARIDSQTISFVIDMPEKEEDEDQYCALTRSKKSFRNTARQMHIDAETMCDESGMTMTYILSWEME